MLHGTKLTGARDRLAGITEANLVLQISHLLTAGVLEGRLRAGERLNEAVLAQELGTSRGPLREAARLLESRGLLVSSPRRGFFVRTIDAKELDDVYDLRLCIERHAAMLAAPRLDEAAKQALGLQVERLHNLVEPDQHGLQIEADFAFHRLICVYSGNARLLRVFDDLAAETRLAIMLIGHLYDDPKEIAATHLPVLDALRSGSAGDVAAALGVHIGAARIQVVSQFNRLKV